MPPYMARDDDALLDAGAGAVVEADQRDADRGGQVHDLVDLLGEHLAQRPAEDGEVLAEDAHLAAVDGAEAGDDAVGVGALSSRPMPSARWRASMSSSWNEPSSRRYSTRSRAVILPLECWRSTAGSEPAWIACSLRGQIDSSAPSSGGRPSEGYVRKERTPQNQPPARRCRPPTWPPTPQQYRPQGRAPPGRPRRPASPRTYPVRFRCGAGPARGSSWGGPHPTRPSPLARARGTPARNRTPNHRQTEFNRTLPR